MLFRNSSERQDVPEIRNETGFRPASRARPLPGGAHAAGYLVIGEIHRRQGMSGQSPVTCRFPADFLPGPQQRHVPPWDSHNDNEFGNIALPQQEQNLRKLPGVSGMLTARIASRFSPSSARSAINARSSSYWRHWHATSVWPFIFRDRHTAWHRQLQAPRRAETGARILEHILDCRANGICVHQHDFIHQFATQAEVPDQPVLPPPHRQTDPCSVPDAPACLD